MNTAPTVVSLHTFFNFTLKTLTLFRLGGVPPLEHAMPDLFFLCWFEILNKVISNWLELSSNCYLLCILCLHLILGYICRIQLLRLVFLLMRNQNLKYCFAFGVLIVVVKPLKTVLHFFKNNFLKHLHIQYITGNIMTGGRWKHPSIPVGKNVQVMFSKDRADRYYFMLMLLNLIAVHLY